MSCEGAEAEIEAPESGGASSARAGAGSAPESPRSAAGASVDRLAAADIPAEAPCAATSGGGTHSFVGAACAPSAGLDGSGELDGW